MNELPCQHQHLTWWILDELMEDKLIFISILVVPAWPTLLASSHNIIKLK